MASIASTDRLRRQNSLLVMQSLRDGKSLSHTEIAERTGLASATVSAITANLLDASYLSKLEQAPAQGRGRPRVLFHPSAMRGYIPVITLSSDSLSFSLFDFSGKLLDRFLENRHGHHGKQALLNLIDKGISRLMERAKISVSHLLHIGLSSKGVIDQLGGRLLWSPIVADAPVDLAHFLKEKFQCSVSVYNETALVAYALWHKIGRQKQDVGHSLVALSLGHNIGLGIARQKGEDLSEPEILAPNFGHMLHSADGALCRCGSRGCIEAYSGFYAILRSAFEVPEHTVPANFVPLSEVEKIASQARGNDRRAAFAFRQAGLAIGNGLARLFSLYGTMPVYIGGPGIRFYDLIEAGLVDGLRQSSMTRFGASAQINLVLDESDLIGDGHRRLALSSCDAHILADE